jgi:hydroxyacylglutathione hydrolase
MGGEAMIPVQHTVDTPYMVGPVHWYTIDYGDEIVLFDTGPPTDAGRSYLRDQIDLDRLKHVLVTHCHIDHYGQSAWLEANSAARIYLPSRDIQKNERLDERLSTLFELIAALGFKQDYMDQLQKRFIQSVMSPHFPENYLVAEEDIPAYLGIEVLCCPGHSQSDLVYTGDGWAVTGDTLLRGVFQSPLLDVDLKRGDRFKNYQAYCSSIVRLAGLSSRQILPGHRRHIDSVERTILFYISKALHRVSYLLPHIHQKTVADVIGHLFSSMTDPFHIYLKASEIVFMKDFLEDSALLAEALKEIGLFEPVADLFYGVVESQER